MSGAIVVVVVIIVNIVVGGGACRGSLIYHCDILINFVLQPHVLDGDGREGGKVVGLVVVRWDVLLLGLLMIWLLLLLLLLKIPNVIIL